MNNDRIHLLFVYGTLKKSYGNHSFLKGADFLGEARTKEKYALYDDGIPFLIKDEGVSQVHGELYMLDEATLRKVDSLEHHPKWYRREEIDVVLDATGKTFIAWAYFYPDEPSGKLVKDGRYL